MKEKDMNRINRKVREFRRKETEKHDNLSSELSNDHSIIAHEVSMLLGCSYDEALESVRAVVEEVIPDFENNTTWVSTNAPTYVVISNSSTSNERNDKSSTKNEPEA